jgi:hypothetical protein
MAGKFVGVDWYDGEYGVFERHNEKYIPVKFSKQVYDCIRYVCEWYDHLDTIYIPETISEIAAMEANESIHEGFSYT